MVDIFDSITHPTLNGLWLNPRFNGLCRVDALVCGMDKFAIRKAFAVGLYHVGGYSHKAFLDMLKPYPQLIPIAACHPEKDLENITRLKSLGYAGIKIHPRLCNLAGDEGFIFDCIKKANDLNMHVLYCGFLGVSEKFIEQIGNEKVLLLHTGGRQLLQTFEKLQGKTNILLDLSYTLTQYPELMIDLKRLVSFFPHRLCVGSDHPEVSFETFRGCFEQLTANMPEVDVRKVAYQNIENFLLSA